MKRREQRGRPAADEDAHLPEHPEVIVRRQPIAVELHLRLEAPLDVLRRLYRAVVVIGDVDLGSR